MYKRVLIGSATIVLLALVADRPSRADELLRFKTGYEMMVISHREEQGVIIVTLDGGGEIGFPKELLEFAEGGKASQRSGPSLRRNRVPPRTPYTAAHLAKVNPAPAPSERVFAQGSFSNGRSIRVGFSMGGDKLERFTGGATGVADKIGTSLINNGPAGVFSVAGATPPPPKKKGPPRLQIDSDEGSPP